MYNSALLLSCNHLGGTTSVADVAFVIAHKSKRNVLYTQSTKPCGFIGTNTPRPDLMV